LFWCFWNNFAWQNQVDELVFFSMDETCAHVRVFVCSFGKKTYVCKKLSQNINVAQAKLKAEKMCK